MTSEAVPAQRRPPEPVPVRHDRWSFELRGEELADIRYDGVLLLRAVRPVVRDRDWGTVPATVVDRRTPAEAGGWSGALRLRFGHPGEEGAVDYAAELVAALDGSGLTVTFTGTSRSAFSRNRIGLVVLHPLAESGRPVEVLHADGSAAPGTWPEAISPHQPFLDVRGFRWERGGVRAELSLEGDVFETEDQRNWTDASFKTYGTPLSQPFPVEVRPGERVLHRFRLRADGRAAPRAQVAAVAPSVDVGERVVGAVPALSLGASTASSEVPEWAGRTPGFEAVLVELTGAPAGWPERVDSAEREAAALGAALDVRVATDDPDRVGAALALLDRTRVVRLSVFDTVGHVTTRSLWEALAAGAADFRATPVAGARSHFAELNRGRADIPPEAAALTCSITPQMHAGELPHLVESLAGQQAVARDAVRLAGERPVHLGPVTLRQRFNAVATSGNGSAGPPDPLQPSAFTAAWTLGSVAALTRPGVQGLCYYEVAGPGGIGDAGGLFPVGRLLAALAGLRGLDVLAVRAPEGVVAYPVRTPDGILVLVSRLAATGLELPVHGPGGARTSVRLDPWSVAQVRVT